MPTISRQITIQGIKVNAQLQEFGANEIVLLKDVFTTWMELNNKIMLIGSSRRANLHEIISEGAFAYFRKCPRLLDFKVERSTEEERARRKEQSAYILNTYGKRKKNELTKEQVKDVNKLFLPKPSASPDCYDLQNSKTVQVKASAGTTDKITGELVHHDTTSFGPRSEFDKIYFLDFYNNGDIDGKFDVYDIPLDDLYNAEVAEGVTLAERQRTEKRPRLSILEKVIAPTGLEPIAHYDLMNP